MSFHLISNTFPDQWIYGRYEREIQASIADQIQQAWPGDNCVLLNTTWLGPATREQVLAIDQPIDRLFLLSTVDYPTPEHKEYLEYLQNGVGVNRVYKLGNWDGDHYFNLFAIVCKDHFEQYDNADLELSELRYRYISYNRKPYPHRVYLVNHLLAQGLDQHGVITMGRPGPGFLLPGVDIPYLSIGEKNQDYVKYGHWYPDSPDSTPHDIPHDLFSLHNWEKWKHHFLHIVNTTADSNHVPLFINQIDFKPILGLRPWITNGQTNHSEFFRRQGFRTFNHWFPDADLETDRTDNNCLYRNQQIARVIEQLASMSAADILSMYRAMLPDLLYNKQRFYSWAEEQQARVHNLFT